MLYVSFFVIHKLSRFFLSSPQSCDSSSGRVGALLSRTSPSKAAAGGGWIEVPCTRLDKGSNSPPPSLRTRSVPIIPSLQACDPKAADPTNTSEQDQAGLLKRQPPPAANPRRRISDSPSPPETVELVNGASPSSVSPPTEKSLTRAPCSVGVSAELVRDAKQKGFSRPENMSGLHNEVHHGGTNPLKGETVQESEGKRIQYSAEALHTRGLEAAGQKEVQGRLQGQTSLANGGANCLPAAQGPSCRRTGNTCAKPSAS